MKINDKDLDGFTAEVVSKCMGTQRERVQAYQGLAHYYLFGAAYICLSGLLYAIDGRASDKCDAAERAADAAEKAAAVSRA